MKVEIAEAVWVDEREEMSLEELAAHSGLPAEALLELVECDVFSAADVAAEGRAFKARCLATARAAGRLRSDFGLEADALALVLALRSRIEDLEKELRRLRAQFPRHAPPRAD